MKDSKGKKSSRKSCHLLVYSLNTATVRSGPCGFQEPRSLSSHCCIPDPLLTEEAGVGNQTSTALQNVGTLPARTKCCLLW